jgi:hypothetical protein
VPTQNSECKGSLEFYAAFTDRIAFWFLKT